METKHEVTIRLSSRNNLESFIGILVSEGYLVTSRVVMKPFPRESSVDHYRVTIEIPYEIDIYHSAK